MTSFLHSFISNSRMWCKLNAFGYKGGGNIQLSVLMEIANASNSAAYFKTLLYEIKLVPSEWISLVFYSQLTNWHPELWMLLISLLFFQGLRTVVLEMPVMQWIKERQIRATSYLAENTSDVTPWSALHRITCYLAQSCHGRMTLKS